MEAYDFLDRLGGEHGSGKAQRRPHGTSRSRCRQVAAADSQTCTNREIFSFGSVLSLETTGSRIVQHNTHAPGQCVLLFVFVRVCATSPGT